MRYLLDGNAVIALLNDTTSPPSPALRDVQHALAPEHGHESWIDLRRALDDGKRRGAATPDADQYDTLANDVLAAYQTGNAAAMERLQERFRRPVTCSGVEIVEATASRVGRLDHPLAQ